MDGYVELNDLMIETLPDNTVGSAIKWPEGYNLNSRGLWFDPGSDKPPLHISGPFTVEAVSKRRRAAPLSNLISCDAC